MSDQSTTPKEVEVPKVVPMEPTWWDKFKKAHREGQRRARQRRIRQKAHQDYMRHGAGKTGKYD